MAEMDGLISSVVRMSSGEITSMLGEKNGGLDDSAVMQRDSVGDGIENPLGASFGTALAPLDDAVDLGGLRLLITKHTIHREDHVGSANHSYVVSKEKWFWLGIQLVDGQGRMAVGNTLDLSACVVYESGVPVNSLVASEPLLLGQLEAQVIRGEAQFKLKMGSSTLSQKHNNQKFRICVHPSDPATRDTHPHLTIHSTPMVSMTKLFRKRPGEGDADGGGARGGGGASAADYSGALIETEQRFDQRLDEERNERELLALKVQRLTAEGEQLKRLRDEDQRTLAAQREQIAACMREQARMQQEIARLQSLQGA